MSAAKKAAKSERAPIRSDYSTVYQELSGAQVIAVTHGECHGLGCAECGGLGFKKSYPGGEPLSFTTGGATRGGD